MKNVIKKIVKRISHAFNYVFNPVTIENEELGIRVKAASYWEAKRAYKYAILDYYKNK